MCWREETAYNNLFCFIKLFFFTFLYCHFYPSSFYFTHSFLIVFSFVYFRTTCPLRRVSLLQETKQLIVLSPVVLCLDYTTCKCAGEVAAVERRSTQIQLHKSQLRILQYIILPRIFYFQNNHLYFFLDNLILIFISWNFIAELRSRMVTNPLSYLGGPWFES